MKFIQKLMLFGGVLCLWALQGQAVEPTKNLGCGSGEVLQLLAQSVQSTNKLDPTLAFNFDDVKTLNDMTRKGQQSLKCEAKLQLINQKEQQVMDSLKVVYELKNNGKNKGYQLSFEPVR